MTLNDNNNSYKFVIVTFIAIAMLISTHSSFADVPKVNIQEERKIIAVIEDYSATANTSSTDSMQLLIRKSENQYQTNQLVIKQRTRIRPIDIYNNSDTDSIILSNLDFDQWLNVSPYRINEVAQYQSYLAQYVGIYNVPPMNQLLTTARSWQDCGYEPYQIPPREIWSNMVETLKLYSVLKLQGILPHSTLIRSVYRSPELNACAGGAAASKHMTNGAIDVWVPQYQGDTWYLNPMQDRLCKFWATQGEKYNFGLGIYSTGSIHIDTQGHRNWGIQFTAADSVCRYIN